MQRCSGCTAATQQLMTRGRNLNGLPGTWESRLDQRPIMSSLTPANHAELASQGYTVVPRVFSPELCRKLRGLMDGTPRSQLLCWHYSLILFPLPPKATHTHSLQPAAPGHLQVTTTTTATLLGLLCSAGIPPHTHTLDHPAATLG